MKLHYRKLRSLALHIKRKSMTIYEISLEEKHMGKEKNGEKLGYTFGQSQTKELLHKVRASEEGGADS